MHKSSIKFSLRRSQHLLACVSVFLLAASFVSACPSCKDAYTPGSSDSAMGKVIHIVFSSFWVCFLVCWAGEFSFFVGKSRRQ